MTKKNALKVGQLIGEERWLSQRQIAQWLGVKTSIVADLIRYLFKTGEFDPRRHCIQQQVAQLEGKREVSRELNCYSRALTLAVASRVHSNAGESFRRWSSQLLEQHLSQGYTLCREQLIAAPESLLALQQQVQDLPQPEAAKTDTTAQAIGAEHELMPLLQGFRRTLLKLYEFEYQKVSLRNTSMLAARPLDYFEVTSAVGWLRDTLFQPGEAGQFGVEKGGQLEALLILVENGGGSHKSYASIEQKAVYLLWLVIHQQPFEEGNLQLAGFLFVWFMQRNGLLYREDGSARLQDNALVSMVLLTSRCPEGECDTLVSLLAGLINRDN